MAVERRRGGEAPAAANLTSPICSAATATHVDASCRRSLPARAPRRQQALQPRRHVRQRRRVTRRIALHACKRTTHTLVRKMASSRPTVIHRARAAQRSGEQRTARKKPGAGAAQSAPGVSRRRASPSKSSLHSARSSAAVAPLPPSFSAQRRSSHTNMPAHAGACGTPAAVSDAETAACAARRRAFFSAMKASSHAVSSSSAARESCVCADTAQK